MSEVRSPRRGIASVAVVAGVLVLVAVVDAWVASATARGTEALSANALRSVELADDMRWQLSRLVPPRRPGPRTEPPSGRRWSGSRATSRAYEPLATFEGERPEWLTLSGLADGLSGRPGARGPTGAVARDAQRRGGVGGPPDRHQPDRGRRHRSSAAGARTAADARATCSAGASGAPGGGPGRGLAAPGDGTGAPGGGPEPGARGVEEPRAGGLRRPRRARPPRPRSCRSTASRASSSGRRRDEADARLATRIVGAASRMSALIEAMLAFSRSGRLPRGRTRGSRAR